MLYVKLFLKRKASNCIYNSSASKSFSSGTSCSREFSKVKRIRLANFERYSSVFSLSFSITYRLIECKELKIKCGFICARKAFISTSITFLSNCIFFLRLYKNINANVKPATATTTVIIIFRISVCRFTSDVSKAFSLLNNCICASFTSVRRSVSIACSFLIIFIIKNRIFI